MGDTQTIGEPIQKFKDVLKKELKVSQQDVKVNENAANDCV